MANILIKKAKKEDAQTIYDLIYELAVFEKEPNAVLASLADYHEQFKKGLFDALVAVFEGKIIGMALFYDTFSTWKGKMLYLEDFVVTQSYRNQGVGQQIFEAVIEEAKARNAKLLKWQVLDWNSSAVKFYEKNAAIIEKEWWNGKIVF